MKPTCAASDDQPGSDASEDDASAALGAARGIGSNSENNTRPAKNPPICACQATLAPSAPIAIDPMPKMMLTPNQTARKPRTRALRNTRVLGFLAVWFGVNIIFGIGSIAIGADGASVAWQAHIGGFF